MKSMFLKDRVLSVLVVFAIVIGCEESVEIPTAPSLSFDEQVTVLDDSVKFEFVITNPSRVTLDEIGVSYYELPVATNIRTTVIETNNSEAEKTVTVKLKLGTNKGYSITPYLSSARFGILYGNSVSVVTGSPRWITLASFPGAGRSGAAMFGIGSKIYVGLGRTSTGTSADFWMYDTNANTWQQLANFPGGARFDVVSFSLNGRGYVGGGRKDVSGNICEVDFWQYEPQSDSWLRIADMPYIQNGNTPSTFSASTFVSSDGAGVAYYGTGNYYGWTMANIYRFDPSAGSWESIPDLPVASHSLSSFMIGNKLFVVTKNTTAKRVFMYDPISNSWTEKSPFPPDGALFEARRPAFSIGDYGYVMTVEGELWKYDPTADSWAQDSNSELVHVDEWSHDGNDTNRASGVYSTQMIVVGNKAYGGLGVALTCCVNGEYVQTPAKIWMAFDPTK